MKKKDIALMAIILLGIGLVFAFITGLIYIQRTKQINKITFESQQQVEILLINDLYEKYEFITAADTYYVSKAYHPTLDWKSIENIDLSERFDIVYTPNELVSVKNDNQKVLYLDIIKIKQEERDSFAKEVFYWFIAICIFMPLMMIIILPLEKWSINKIEKNILLIPNITKIKDQLFHYSYKEINFIFIHHYYSNANFIRVYIPVTAENLIIPNNMHTEKIDNQPYCYFDYRLFIHAVNAKKIQSKIDSKFKKVP
jgi:hypothetical protein